MAERGEVPPGLHPAFYRMGGVEIPVDTNFLTLDELTFNGLFAGVDLQRQVELVEREKREAKERRRAKQQPSYQVQSQVPSAVAPTLAILQQELGPVEESKP